MPRKKSDNNVRQDANHPPESDNRVDASGHDKPEHPAAHPLLHPLHEDDINEDARQSESDKQPELTKHDDVKRHNCLESKTETTDSTNKDERGHARQTGKYPVHPGRAAPGPAKQGRHQDAPPHDDIKRRIETHVNQHNSRLRLHYEFKYNVTDCHVE